MARKTRLVPSNSLPKAANRLKRLSADWTRLISISLIKSPMGRFNRMLKSGGWGSWDDPRARATRGLRRMRGNRQTVLPARRAPTIKRWSLDARSEEQSAYSFWDNQRLKRPSPEGLIISHP